jgi:hypothetical protein
LNRLEIFLYSVEQLQSLRHGEHINPASERPEEHILGAGFLAYALEMICADFVAGDFTAKLAIGLWLELQACG